MEVEIAGETTLGYGGLSSVDPDRWEDIPDRGGYIRTDDKWPNEWAD